MIKSKDLWLDAVRKMKKSKLAVVCFWIFVAYVFVALLVKFGLVGADWGTEVAGRYEPPSADKVSTLFGTDIFGRSVLVKTLMGASVAMTVGLVSSLISVVIGLSLGSMAGYFGKWVDDLIVWFYTTVSSIPSIMLLLAIAYVMDKGLITVCIAIGLTSWVGLARVVRGEVLKHKNREYVLAARSLGAGHFSCIFKHILPNVFHQVIISFSLQFQSAIKSEVILSYLGLGVQGQPSWGIMIDDSKSELLRGVWWQLSAATIAMFGLVLALNILGDALRDALDPKLK